MPAMAINGGPGPGEQPHVLVVDDDDRLRVLLHRFLSGNGLLVTTAGDAADARRKLASVEFDMIVLDRMMPGESGLDFLVDVRRTNRVPVLMLTAMGESDDRIGGLAGGADDYLVKPFEPRELLLRIHAILRRALPSTPPVEIRLGSVVFDPVREALTRDGRPIRLSGVEAALLRALAREPGAVLSREDLIARTGAPGGGRAVDVQVTRLRRKIERDPHLPRYLQTVRGRGYVLRPD